MPASLGTAHLQSSSALSSPAHSGEVPKPGTSPVSHSVLTVLKGEGLVGTEVLLLWDSRRDLATDTPNYPSPNQNCQSKGSPAVCLTHCSALNLQPASAAAGRREAEVHDGEVVSRGSAPEVPLSPVSSPVLFLSLSDGALGMQHRRILGSRMALGRVRAIGGDVEHNNPASASVLVWSRAFQDWCLGCR